MKTLSCLFGSSKGVSPLVAGMLLLVIASAVGFLVYTWSIGYVIEARSAAEKTGSFVDCHEVSYGVASCSFVPGALTVRLESWGSQDLNGFNATVTYLSFESSVLESTQSLPGNGGNDIVFSPDHNLQPHRVIVFPVECPSIRADIENCSYSNDASSQLSFSGSGDFNHAVLGDDGAELSQDSSTKTFTDSDFGSGSFDHTKVASIELNGELDHNCALPATLRAYYKMNSLNSQTTDASDYNNDASLVGQAWLYPGFWDSNALKLNGSQGNYLTASDDSSLDLTSSVTVSVWIKPDSTSQGTILSKQGAYELYLEDGFVVGLVKEKQARAALSE